MLKVHNGRIDFIEKHLFEPAITKFEGILERYSGYEVEMFLHIVSDPGCRYESGAGANRVSRELADLSAKERFTSLIDKRVINANPKGFYANKVKNKRSHPREIKSVSLSYCKQTEVDKHFAARKSEYGMVFFHDFLQEKGMIPVRYINEEEDEESIRRLVFNEAFALEAYGISYDMRWENEWRINCDVKLEIDDVAFLIVPDAEYHEYIELIIEKGLEYYILPSSVFTNPLKFFLMAHNMEHHSWSQITVYDGWKVDFEIFPDLNSDEEAEFLERCGEHLRCLAAVEVQGVYEKRFVSRFLTFASSLTEEFLDKTSFKELELVSINADEPYQTHRDLMMHCYTERLKVQRDRIIFV